jgi:hypothetical protein
MEHISICGPVELNEGKLQLRIPLIDGGLELSEVARGISVIDDDVLVVTIPAWLAERLGIEDGTSVIVDNKDGKFNIRVNNTLH